MNIFPWWLCSLTWIIHPGIWSTHDAKIHKQNEFRIAWLAPSKEYYQFSAASSVGALKMALLAIKNGSLLENNTISVRWYDSDCSLKSGMTVAVDAKQDFLPHVFLGPPCSAAMRGVAILASHWNIPVFGWVSQAAEFQNKSIYSTLVRFLGPYNRFPLVMNYIQSLFKWNVYSLMYEEGEPYQGVAGTLDDEKEGGTIEIKSKHVVSVNMDTDKLMDMYAQIKGYTRIIIFAVPWLSMRRYMLVAHEMGMTTGEFAFICIHGDVYTPDVLEREVFSDRVWKRNDTDDDKAREAFESVLHVIMDISNDTRSSRSMYEKFIPFGAYQNNHWNLPNKTTQADAYAPFLYEATFVWAIIADNLFKKKEDLLDGRRFVKEFWNIGTIAGLTFNIELDANRDRKLNFQILDMNEHGKFDTIFRFTYNENGTTAKQVNDTPVDRLSRWPNGKIGIGNAPPDTPECGFDGKKCAVTDKHHNVKSYIIGGAAGGSVFILTVAISIVFNVVMRRYHRMKRLKNMVWQVKYEDIDYVTPLINGSVSSFKNLTRRKSSGKKRKNCFQNGLRDCTSAAGISPNNSPAQFCRPEYGAMFGSMAYVKGNPVSVKRLTKSNINLANIQKHELLELNRLIEMKNQNCCAFVGACIDPGRIILLWEYCAKGSLQDIIWNQNIKLERMYMFSLSQDIAKGLDFLHKSCIHYHGNLKSSHCVVDSRWTCKLVEFGVPSLRKSDESYQGDTEPNKQQWTAPEILRCEKTIDKQKADIYSLGIILKEIFTRSGPYTEYSPPLSMKDIILKVKRPVMNKPAFRPMLKEEISQSPELVLLFQECWNENLFSRPTAGRVFKTLTRINPSKLSMIDNMIAILEKHANHLEELVAERTSELDIEKKKTESLLYRMLPQSVADKLKTGDSVEAEHYDEATIYFSDIVGFTSICVGSTPIQVVNFLNSLYTLFDDIITKYKVYKVETIGDAYMLASGLPERIGNQHSKEIADCAMDIMASIASFSIPHQPENHLRIRVGMHSGPVVAGVVGLAMPRYCLFGDTVNTASRMESTGLPMKIHLSEMVKEKLEIFQGYQITYRGEIDVKGKGKMKTYFLTGKDGRGKDIPNLDTVSQHIASSTLNDCMYDSAALKYSSSKGETGKTLNGCDMSNYNCTCAQICVKKNGDMLQNPFIQKSNEIKNANGSRLKPSSSDSKLYESFLSLQVEQSDIKKSRRHSLAEQEKLQITSLPLSNNCKRCNDKWKLCIKIKNAYSVSSATNNNFRKKINRGKVFGKNILKAMIRRSNSTGDASAQVTSHKGRDEVVKIKPELNRSDSFTDGTSVKKRKNTMSDLKSPRYQRKNIFETMNSKIKSSRKQLQRAVSYSVGSRDQGNGGHSALFRDRSNGYAHDNSSFVPGDEILPEDSKGYSRDSNSFVSDDEVEVDEIMNELYKLASDPMNQCDDVKHTSYVALEKEIERNASRCDESSDRVQETGEVINLTTFL